MHEIRHEQDGTYTVYQDGRVVVYEDELDFAIEAVRINGGTSFELVAQDGYRTPYRI